MDFSVKATRFDLRRDLARFFKARVEVYWDLVAELSSRVVSQNADGLASQDHWLQKETNGEWA